MQAERVLLRTDDQGNPIGVPKLPPNAQLEAIFLLSDSVVALPARRVPPPWLKGAVTSTADLVEPVVSNDEWEVSLDRTVRQIAGEPGAFE